MSSKTKTKPTMLDEELIEELCEYVKRGATDIAVCRIVGIAMSTFSRWKREGKEEGSDIIYRKFYAAYELAKGRRELSWIEQINDPKWLLSRHPDTKNAWAEIRYQKDEYSGTLTKIEAEERRKAIEKDVINGFDTINQQLESADEVEAEVPGEPEDTE